MKLLSMVSILVLLVKSSWTTEEDYPSTENLDSDIDYNELDNEDIEAPDDHQPKDLPALIASHVLYMDPNCEYVTFTLYTRENPNGTVFHASYRDDRTWIRDLPLLHRFYDNTKPTKFITHGWQSSGESYQCTVLKNTISDMYDANVFVMDYSNFVTTYWYIRSVAATWSVARLYTGFLNQLIENHGADLKTFHLIGYSLGAHVSGFAARSIRKGKVGRITGLDPAFPGFGHSSLLAIAFNELGNWILQLMDDRALLDRLGHMSQNDADFVDVIHTGSGILGMWRRMGHADFYPNGGFAPQPGCENKFIPFVQDQCSHSMSWKMFAESVKHADTYKAYRCHSYNDFKKRRKTCSEEPVFMGNSVPLSASGKYYLETQYQIF